MYRSLILVWLLVATMTPVAHAQAWARKMFKTTSHDFGTVAKGSKSEFDFEFENIFVEDIHIAGVRSSCGCTEPQITRQTLKTGETGSIHAVLNTRKFSGSRGATLTVIIDKPYYAEVQLTVRGYIRNDVLFTPGSVSFGDVEQGRPMEQTISVSYAGRNDWAIVDVRSANPSFEVELTDGPRNFGRVTYSMIVRLKGDAPPGYLQDQLTIVTNDAYKSTVDLPVEGRIVSPLTVSPASLKLGKLKPGETVVTRLFVKSSKPFRIVSIECDGDCFKFEPSDQATAMHLVPVTFTAGETPGKFSRKIEIKTDLGPNAITTCVASATIADSELSDVPTPTSDGSQP